MKRARHFIICNGRRPDDAAKSRFSLLQDLMPSADSKTARQTNNEQLELFTAGAP
jgi:hypothetical protein